MRVQQLLTAIDSFYNDLIPFGEFLAQFFRLHAIRAIEPGMIQNVPKSESLVGIPPGYTLKEVFEFRACSWDDALENVPKGFPIRGTQTFEIRIFLMGTSERRASHYHQEQSRRC